MTDGDKEKDIFENYERRSVELQRSYILLLGFGLFFLFMILIPVYSLKHDSTTMTRLQWLNNNVSLTLSKLDEILNSSKVIDGTIQTYLETSNKRVDDIRNYANTLNSIKYFNQSLGMMARENLIEKKLENLVIYPNCIEETRINNSLDCNLKKQIETTATNMFSSFNKTISIIDNDVYRIHQAVVEINDSSGRINKQFDSGQLVVDFIEVKKLLPEIREVINNSSRNLSAIDQKLDSTAKIRPSSPLDFYLVYPNGQVFGFDALRSVVSDVLSSKQRSDLLQLKNALDEINTKITDESDKLEGRYNQFQSPIGNIPIGFNEAIGIFPLALAAGFYFYVYLLIDTNKWRRTLLNILYLNLLSRIDRHVSMLSPLWIDPSKRNREQIVPIIVLFIPFLIFIAAFVMVMHILFFFDSPFPYSVDTNRIVYSALSIIGLILFIYSYIKFFFIEFSPINR